jgi:hypothetical protein
MCQSDGLKKGKTCGKSVGDVDGIFEMKFQTLGFHMSYPLVN